MAKWTFSDAMGKRIAKTLADRLQETGYRHAHDLLVQALNEEEMRSFDAVGRMLAWLEQNEKHGIVCLVAENLDYKYRHLKKLTDTLTATLQELLQIGDWADDDV